MAVPERKAHTVTVATAAADDYPVPTDIDTLVALKNISENTIWLCHLTGGTASAEGADCEPILAGEVVYVHGGKDRLLNMIADTGDSKLVMINAQDRM